jgi:hypothetical protein
MSVASPHGREWPIGEIDSSPDYALAARLLSQAARCTRLTRRSARYSTPSRLSSPATTGPGSSSRPRTSLPSSPSTTRRSHPRSSHCARPIRPSAPNCGPHGCEDSELPGPRLSCGRRKVSLIDAFATLTVARASGRAVTVARRPSRADDADWRGGRAVSLVLMADSETGPPSRPPSEAEDVRRKLDEAADTAQRPHKDAAEREQRREAADRAARSPRREGEGEGVHQGSH